MADESVHVSDTIHPAPLSATPSSFTPLRGTKEDDPLVGENGDDEVFGLGGDDTINGRRGHDRLKGQAGDDSIKGAGGEDTLIGGGGSDTLKGGGGADSLKGGGGEDRLAGGGGSDTLKGGGGADSLNGGGGDDVLAGGGKNDTLDGSRGDDRLKGGGGDDLILGGAGSDRIAGGRGADVIRYRDADFASGETDTILGFKSGEDRIDLTGVSAAASGLRFVMVDGSVALAFGEGRIVLRGVSDLSLLSADDFLLPEGANAAPVVSGPIEETAFETDAAFSVDLLANASDPDPFDALEATSISILSGDAAGVSIEGGSLNVDPGAYARLGAGKIETTVFSYMVTDGRGGAASQTASIEIVGVNSVPTSSGPLSASLSEDDAAVELDLLANIVDPDAGDELSIVSATPASGDARGVAFNGGGLSVDPGAYGGLAAGAAETVVFDYTVSDGAGGALALTATIAILGVNDAPVLDGPLRTGATAVDGTFSVNLLEGARDPDSGDVLAISDFQLASGDASGVTRSGAALQVDPAAYVGLAGDEEEVITFTYDVIDGNGGLAAQTATVTIAGSNEPPAVSAPLMAMASEDDAAFALGLLTGATDPDRSDTLSVSGLSLVSGDASGISFSGAALEVDPGAYDRLGGGETETIVYSFLVTDGKGGATSQTATIMIAGMNDASTLSGPVREGRTEDDDRFAVDLLAGAADPDATDTLSVSGLSLVSGDASGVTVGDAALDIDPSAYDGLAAGEVETIVYDYDVIDGAGGTVGQTAVVTIAGVNDAPVVAGQVVVITSEADVAREVNLLAGASDPDLSDTLSVANLVLVDGDAAGVGIFGDEIEIDPADYGRLIFGESETIRFSYDVIDGQGGAVAQTATITIGGADNLRTSTGDDGVDEFEGTNDNDQFFALGGDDVLVGGGGDDLLFGGADDDILGTSRGADRLSGGPGADRFVIRLENGEIDATPDVVADFDPLIDTLDFREAVEPTTDLGEFVSFVYNATRDETTVRVNGSDAVILEGISQSFDQLLAGGSLDFLRPNLQFQENPFGFANLVLAGGPASVVELPSLSSEDEFYVITGGGGTGGGEVFLSGSTITFDPSGIFLLPDEFGNTTVNVSHFDEFGVEATTTVSWGIEPGNQPPEIFEQDFFIFEDEGFIEWNLDNFSDDDFFTYEGFFGDVSFRIIGEPSLGVATLNGSIARFELGEDFPDLEQGEFQTVTIGIEIEDAEGATASADFTVTVEGLAEQLVVDGGSLTDTIEAADDTDLFRVELRAGIRYAIEMRGSPTGDGDLSDPLVTLRNDSFNFIAANDDAGVGLNSLLFFTPDTTDTYFVDAGAFGTRTGSYELEITRPDDFGETRATAGFTFPGSSVSGEIDEPGDLDLVSINLFAGDTYQFDLRGLFSGVGTLSDPFLRLRDADGLLLAEDDDGGLVFRESLIVFTPEESGEYLLEVDSFASALTGTWQLSAELLI